MAEAKINLQSPAMVCVCSGDGGSALWVVVWTGCTLQKVAWQKCVPETAHSQKSRLPAFASMTGNQDIDITAQAVYKSYTVEHDNTEPSYKAGYPWVI